MIKYIGSKRLLIPAIMNIVQSLPNVKTVLDLFSGTSRVGHAMKAAGYQVVSNDHNAYAATIARCYVQADLEDVQADAKKLVHEFNAMHGDPGYFTDTFCIQSRFFQPKNGARVDAIREAIVHKALPPELEAVMLVSLMEAADRVDSTTGLQMAYLKQWAPRALHDMELRVPDVLPRAQHGKGVAVQMEAIDAVCKFEVDAAYIDPPYNQHSYLSNYHIWESLVRWDKPEVYGIACKRIDCRSRGSIFNSKPRFEAAFTALIENIRAQWIIMSFNNEGYLTRDAAERMLRKRGVLRVIEHDFKRYVGAQIGIYNLSGKKVGKVDHLRNKEYLFTVECS